MTRSTHTIYKYLAEVLQNRIDKANRRAQRIGQPGYTLTITSADPEPVYDDERIAHWHRDSNGQPDYPLDSANRPMIPTEYRERVTATIDGIIPQLPGQWEFIGLVEEDSIIGPMPKLIGDDAQRLTVNLDAYRDVDTWNDCDHCHVRRDRTKVYLLRSSETGAITRVGSTCLAAFLGITFRLPEDSFAMLKDAEELEEMTWFGGPDDTSYRIDHVLAVAHAMVATYGWMSSANARYTPGAISTGERVSALIKAKGLTADLKRNEMIDDVPVATISEMIAFASGMRETDDSEYARTISAIVRGNHENHSLVSGRNVKILASVVSSYQRAKSREAEAAAGINSEYVGTVKKRETFSGLKVIFSRMFDGYYGERQLVKFVDVSGNVFVWWNTGSTDPKVDEVYDVTGTPKSHEEREGVKQTVLTRCRIVAVS